MAEFTENQIDDYLLGRLDKKTKTDMENTIRNNPTLAKTVNNRRTVLKLVDAFGDIEMMDEIKSVHQKEMARKGKIIPFRRWGLAIAAAITLAIGFFCWNWLASTPTLQELYADNYAPYPVSSGARDNTDINKILVSAETAYKDADYKTALPLFQEYFFQ